MQCYIVEGKSKRLRLWYDFTVIQQSSKTIIQTQRNNISQDRIYIYIGLGMLLRRKVLLTTESEVTWELGNYRENATRRRKCAECNKI